MEPNPYKAPILPSDPPSKGSASPVGHFILVEVLIIVAAIMTLWGLLFPGAKS